MLTLLLIKLLSRTRHWQLIVDSVKKLVVMLAAVVTLMSTGCQKGDDVMPGLPVIPDQPTQDSGLKQFDYLPAYTDCDAVFAAIQHSEFNTAGYETKRGGARAIFPIAGGTLINAGEVKVDNTLLQPDGSNNKYSYSDISNPVVYNPNHVRWNVGGNANFSAMNFMITTGFPMVTEIMSGDTLDQNKPYNLFTDYPAQEADSIQFSIVSSNGYIYSLDKSQEAATEHTFQPSILHNLAKGDAYVKVIAFQNKRIYVNEKYVRYLNQSVVTKKIFIR